MKDKSSLENKRKHASITCTVCMDDGVRAVLKTQYQRVKGKFVPSGLFQCEWCGRIAIISQNYNMYRTAGLHILWNLETLQEPINQ